MSTIAADINTYSKQINDFKREFLAVSKTDEKRSQDILRSMRQIHGSALMLEFEKKMAIDRSRKATVEQLVELSTMSSIIHVIHGNIRNCEKMLFAQKRGESIAVADLWSSDEHNSNSTLGVTSMGKALESRTNYVGMGPEIRLTSGPDNTDILSINIPTSEKMPVVKGGTNAWDVTNSDVDFNTTEAERMFRDYDIVSEAMFGGMSKNSNAIILFYADWCPSCKNFMPTWEETKLKYATKNPNAYLTEYNVGEDAERMKIAKMAGARVFPTLYARKGDHKDLLHGTPTIEDLNRFIDKNV